MNHEIIRASLDANDAGALAVMAKIRFPVLKQIGHHFGMGTGYGMTKAQYLERAQLVLPRQTAAAIEQARYAARLVGLADRFETARQFRELCAGALFAGGYNERNRDEPGMARYASEMAQLAAEFASTSRAAGVPDAIKTRCEQIMDAANHP